MSQLTAVHLVSLGCARNDVDSEELAARLEDGGFRLVDEPADADAVMVNTCGFIEAAKMDSISTLQEAADLNADGKDRAIVAVGCMAERYGAELAEALPEADAVLGFDDYGTIAERLTSILAGNKHTSHVPRDRRKLLPISPSARPAAAAKVSLPGHASRLDVEAAAPDLPATLAPASGPRATRRRLGSGPSSPVKIASGCDRRCTGCALPRFRGAYVSRPAEQIVEETRWLADHGVREAFLVSENTSSYGKDLGDIRALEKLLGSLSEIEKLDWIRVSYLQPAETRPELIAAMASVPKVVPYFDLSFQHASATVLRRMRRFGDPDSFLDLINRIRDLAPHAGLRTNVIAGFPGETEADVAVLRDFLIAAELDVVGVFGYSDEEDTAAEKLDGHIDADEIEARRSDLTDLVGELMDQRASERIGESVSVLIEEMTDEGLLGRSVHQGPEVDGTTLLVNDGESPWAAGVGDIVAATVTGSDGVDLIAEPR
ncbi:MAG: 30S ribosomal protein S12 methylthiotransferase RimO [Micrococcales bacterium]|nr:30S ribosomal protein S12 methylthiotransferase RimO [Micrococcales bacterium]